MKQNTSSTRRLAVNAAFLKDIKDDSHHLKVLLEKISPMVSHEKIASNHWGEIVELWSELRDQLALHFSLEEAYGYFEEAIDTAPELSTKAEQLRGQHTQLFESIRRLVEAASEAPADQEERIAKLLTRYMSFIKSFQVHEEAELTLILEALDSDLGVCD
ncbi:hemerythrin domain-containing protein [Novipirellula artificiosorum]|uniref:Hemerythrin-like domain-containing protein n=1 Tax=Novipirellula artificiosorum TaxID=2528016 RepID=A0A5C6DGM0_9BACT|nr:hemerythrin domain-containing protein [Novipirellula artificiosorum]TWU35124.1 hypothetical protein Poly41_42680 [Novipirellula artificiosorum]